MQMDTHRRNFIVNIENSELISFPNGNLEFHKDSIIVKEQNNEIVNNINQVFSTSLSG